MTIGAPDAEIERAVRRKIEVANPDEWRREWQSLCDKDKFETPSLPAYNESAPWHDSYKTPSLPRSLKAR